MSDLENKEPIEKKEEDKYIVYSAEELKNKYGNDDKGLIDYVLKGEDAKEALKHSKIDIQEHMKTWLPIENEKIKEANKKRSEEEQEPLLEFIDLQDEEDLLVDDIMVKRGFDFSEKAKGIIIVPFYDEREEEHYKNKYMGVVMVPPRGFYIYLDTNVTDKPFAVYTVDTYRADIPLKMGDTRFPDKRRKRNDTKAGLTYEDIKELYYDYEKGEYVHVVEKTDEKGKPIETEEMVELKKRKDAISYINKRFYKVIRKYREISNAYYEKFTNDTRSVKKVSQYQKIFMDYIALLSEFEFVLPVKFILRHMDKEEYDFLLEKSKEMKGDIYKKIEELNKVLSNEGTYDYNFSTAENKEKYMELYNSLGAERKNGFLRYLYSFIESRREYKKDPPLSTQGYLVLKDKKTKLGLRLIPNLATLEKRDFYTFHQWSKDKEEEFKQKVLKSYNDELIKKRRVPTIASEIEKQFSSVYSNLLYENKLGNEVQVKEQFSDVFSKLKNVKGTEKENFKIFLEYINKLQQK